MYSVLANILRTDCLNLKSLPFGCLIFKREHKVSKRNHECALTCEVVLSNAVAVMPRGKL